MMEQILVATTNFRVDIDAGGIAHVVFQPAGGMPVLDMDGHRALAGIWRRLDEHAVVKVILVQSEGKGFCAGGDMAMVENMLDSPPVRARAMAEARELVRGMVDCGKPIVAAINGAAVGAGLAVALLADISIVAKGAKLIDGHTKLGVAAGDHAALLWPLLCGMAKAKYYLLLCETVSGEEAERIGLVSAALDAGQVGPEALAIARRLAVGSPSALAHTKRSLNLWLQAAWPAFEASLNAEFMGFAEADAREGLTALKEKRVPQFGRTAFMKFAELHQGRRIEAGPTRVLASEIVEFARKFDNQWFHTDPMRAESGAWNGLIASGFHTCAIAMQMVAATILEGSESYASPGLAYVKWPNPVRPNDLLTLQVEVIESKVSASKPWLGVIRWNWRLLNQHALTVLDLEATSLFKLDA